MNILITRAQQSRLHLLSMQALRLTEDTEQTPENIAKNAFCELLSFVSRDHADPEIWEVLAKAQCLEELIYEQNGDGGGSVRVSELAKNFNVDRHIAILIGKLCGLTAREQNSMTVLATNSTSPLLKIPENAVKEFFDSMEF